MAKEEKVTVIHPLLGEQQLNADHADRLMKLHNNGGWTIKQSKNAIKRRNKGNTKDA